MAPMTPEVGMLAICHADILREWNQLDDARDQALRGISMCQQGGSVLFALLGCAILMRVYLSRGELAEAGRTLEKFDAIGRNANPDIYHFVRSAYFSVDQVRFWLASDNLERALFWTHEVDEQADFVKPSMFDRVEVAYARVLLARQQPKLALQRLDPLLLRAVEEKRRDYVIEISLLQALAYQQQGNVHEAVGVLAHAVQLGEEEGYIRRFVDEGPRIKFLLTRLREQGGKQWDSWYIDTILTAFPQRSVEEIAVLPKPLVSLSVREIEVLRMLAQGVSNQDIAHELVVSINTVKRHVHNIFDKLEAANRTQAVIRARELSLF
jgi:LuxR family maltose regulon positive regulatory protein